MIKYLLIIASFSGLTACSTLEMDPRSDASQPLSTSEMNMPPKDDNCCLKYSAQGHCLQEKTPGCTRQENLNIKTKEESIKKVKEQ